MLIAPSFMAVGRRKKEKPGFSPLQKNKKGLYAQKFLGYQLDSFRKTLIIW